MLPLEEKNHEVYFLLYYFTKQFGEILKHTLKGINGETF